MFKSGALWAALVGGPRVSIHPAGKSTAATSLIPVFSVLFCFALLGERFTLPQILAAATVLAGVLLTRVWEKG